MRHSRLTRKEIALTISFFVPCACFSNSLYAQLVAITQQSNCFTISLVHGDTAMNGVGCVIALTCSPDGIHDDQCARYIDITICSDKCPGLDPTTFIIHTNSSTDCHAVCSPTGDFHSLIDGLDMADTCSWYDPRTIITNNLGGIADGHCATFRISHVNDGQTYHIKLPAGTKCGNITCTDAIISF